jgi:hypothetical protein
LLALAGVFEVGNAYLAHLAHGRLGSGGHAIFAYPEFVRKVPKPPPVLADKRKSLGIKGLGSAHG